MFRKRSLIIIIFPFFLLAPLIGAQETATSGQLSNFEQAKQDYLFQYANYTEAHKEYLNTKGYYQKFQTLAAQKDAIEKTRKTLILRAESMRTYLQLIKIRLNNQRSIISTLRDSQLGKIEATQSFLKGNQDNLNKSQSITELNSESQRLEREMVSFYDLSYETLSVIIISEMQDLELKTRNLYEKTKASTEIEPGSQLERAVIEIELRLSSARLNIDRANQAVVDFQSAGKKTKTSTVTYNTVKGQAQEFKETLKTSLILIRELLNYIQANE